MCKKAIRRERNRPPFSLERRTGRKFVAADGTREAVEFQINPWRVSYVWWIRGHGWTNRVVDALVSTITETGAIVVDKKWG